MNTLRRMWTGLILNSRCTFVFWGSLNLSTISSDFLEGSLRPSSSDVFGGKEWLRVRDVPRPLENIRFFNINGLVSHSSRVTTLSTHPLPRKKSLSQLNWIIPIPCTWRKKNWLYMESLTYEFVQPSEVSSSLCSALYVGFDSSTWFRETYKALPFKLLDEQNLPSDGSGDSSRRGTTPRFWLWSMSWCPTTGNYKIMYRNQKLSSGE